MHSFCQTEISRQDSMTGLLEMAVAGVRMEGLALAACGDRDRKWL